EDWLSDGALRRKERRRPGPHHRGHIETTRNQLREVIAHAGLLDKVTGYRLQENSVQKPRTSPNSKVPKNLVLLWQALDSCPLSHHFQIELSSERTQRQDIGLAPTVCRGQCMHIAQDTLRPV